MPIQFTWNRVPFLSTVPDRVTLATMERVSRCRDEHVELTRVTAAPEGVKAIVSSPKEVTVMVKDVL